MHPNTSAHHNPGHSSLHADMSFLHAMSQSTDPVGAMHALLEAACRATGAYAGIVAIAAEKPFSVTIGTSLPIQPSRLHELVVDIAPGTYSRLSLTEFSLPPDADEAVLIPVYSENLLVGAALLVFNTDHPGGDIAQPYFAMLANGAAIVKGWLDSVYAASRADQFATSLVNAISDPLIMLNALRHVVSLNPAAEQVFQTSLVEARGKPVEAIVRSPELLAFLDSQAATHAEWLSEDGRTFMPRLEAVRSADNRIEGWVVLLNDVTRFRRLIRNQSEFTRIVSHDLRSPMTSMQGFASMLEMVGDLNDRQKHFVEKILSGITQMTALVENIQDAGRYDPETGFYEMSRTQCDVCELVTRITKNHLVPAEKQELTLTVQTASDVPIIHADATMLERAVTNLIDNAIKYTPNGGTVRVEVQCVDNQLVVSVKDDGLGISPENQKLLFERHYRIARQEHRRIKGSGLGLFIVRSVAQRHGGRAWVESTEGNGSTFKMSIPLEGDNLIAGQS